MGSEKTVAFRVPLEALNFSWELTPVTEVRRLMLGKSPQFKA